MIIVVILGTFFLGFFIGTFFGKDIYTLTTCCEYCGDCDDCGCDCDEVDANTNVDVSTLYP